MKKLLTTLLLLSAFPSSSFALARFSGWCERGNTQAITQSKPSSNRLQGSFPSATLTVYIADTSPLVKATLYSDSSGTPLANPFTCTNGGYYNFWAAVGNYDVTFSGAGIAVPYTVGAFVTSGGGGGSVLDVILHGTSNQVTATGACSSTSSIDCTFSLPTSLVFPGSMTVNAGRLDATGATSTAPMKTGASLPGVCAVGDFYYLTTATAGTNVYACTSSNVWTQQGGSGGGGGGGGTLTSVTLTGVANQVTLGGTCVNTVSITCVFSIPSDFRLPGTINKLTLTQPATGATVTIADGKTFTVNRSLTFTGGADGVTITFPSSSATVATLGLANTFTAANDFTGGSAIVTTQAPGNNTTLAASTAFVQAAVTGGIACATCVTAAASLGANAVMTGDGLKAAKVPNTAATLDTSGNYSTPGSIETGVGGSVGGLFGLGQGTLPVLDANTFSFIGPASVPSAYGVRMPGTALTEGQYLWFGAPSSGVSQGTWIDPAAVWTSAYSGSVTNAIAALNGSVGTVIVNQSVAISAAIALPSSVYIECIPGVTITQSNAALDVIAPASGSSNNGVIGCNLAGGKDGISGFNLNNFVAQRNVITAFHSDGIVLGKPVLNTRIDANIIKSGTAGCVDGIFSEDPGSALWITDNIVDTTGCTDHGIAVHTFSSGGTANQLAVTGNVIAQHGSNFGIEIEQVSSGTVIPGCMISRNSVTQAAAGNGGISVVSTINCAVSDNEVDLGGFNPAIDGIEIANSTNPSVTGNHVYGGAANTNALSIDSSSSGTFTGNVLGGYVIIVNSGTFSGVTTLSKNNFSNNVILLPASSTGTKTVWLQCNVSAGVCSNNILNNNTITGVSVGSSYGIYLEADGHTLDSTQVVNNKTFLVTTAVSQDGGTTDTFNPPQAIHGVGTSLQTYSGSFATDDCAKFDSAGTLISAGAACGTGSGGISALTGDVTASGTGSVVATVAKVNGIAYSATAAAHTVQVTTTADTAVTAKVMPDCTDTIGKHLNFTQSTDTFSCGTSVVPAGIAYGVTTVTPPVIADWTTFGSAGTGGTRTDLATNGPTGGPVIKVTGSISTQNIYGISTPVAAGDFTHIFVFWSAVPQANFGLVMAGFSDGTKVEGMGPIYLASGGQTGAVLSGNKATSLTGATYSGANGLTGSGVLSAGGLTFVKLSRSGTNLSGYISIDEGITWDLQFNDTTPFLTASDLVLICDPRGAASPSAFTFISYN